MVIFFFMVLILSNVLFKFFGGKFFCHEFPKTSVIDLLLELLAQSDDDALGTADVGEPIRVFVLHHFADQFGAVGKQARDDSSMSSTANMMRRIPSSFTGAFSGPVLIASGVWNLSSSIRP